VRSEEKTNSGSNSNLPAGATRPRPEPLLANATFLRKTTKDLIDKLPVEVHEDQISADYSNIEAKRARFARKAVELIHDKLEFASMDPSRPHLSTSARMTVLKIAKKGLLRLTARDASVAAIVLLRPAITVLARSTSPARLQTAH
jgi:hypothetical protein